jgi:hypothetical protein
MKREATSIFEASDDNDEYMCGPSVLPRRNGPLDLASLSSESLSLSSSQQAYAVFDGNVLHTESRVTSTGSMAAASGFVTARPLWWSTQMRFSRRNLLEESLCGIEDRHVNHLTTPTKRKSSQRRLDDDNDDGNKFDNCIVRGMHMYQRSSASRRSKMSRRCYSMFDNIPTSSSNNNNNNNMTFNCMNQRDGDEAILPPSFSLLRDGSCSITTSQTVSDATSSDELEDDHSFDNDLTDDGDDTAMRASVISRPVLKRSSTIKDHIDLAASMEAFRTSLFCKQQLQPQNDFFIHDDDEYDDDNLR